nr:hypothetical protein orf521 [uncultured bacterium]AGD93314.1 hypothetical protein orf521 [uncultured bacterium]
MYGRDPAGRGHGSVSAGDRVDPQQRAVDQDAHKRGPREGAACAAPRRSTPIERARRMCCRAARAPPAGQVLCGRPNRPPDQQEGQPAERRARRPCGRQKPRLSRWPRHQVACRQRLRRVTGLCRGNDEPPFAVLAVVADFHAMESRGEPHRPRHGTRASGCLDRNGVVDRPRGSSVAVEQQIPRAGVDLPDALPHRRDARGQARDRIDVLRRNGVDAPDVENAVIERIRRDGAGESGDAARRPRGRDVDAGDDERNGPAPALPRGPETGSLQRAAT